MKPEDCPKLDECYKIKIVLDKDLLDFQYAEAMRAVCAHCTEVQQSVVDELFYVAPEGEGQGRMR